MSDPSPAPPGASLVWLVRHGETAWSRAFRHTSFTDLELTPEGEGVAAALAPRLAEEDFSLVLSSPMLRARRTAELAGFADAVLEDDLREWGYGDYEGITTAELRQTRPDWTMWTHGAPGGEPAAALTERLDRVIARVRATPGQVLLFGHAHSLRALTARWLGLPVADGAHFRLDTASVSQLGYERETPVIIRWNG